MNCKLCETEMLPIYGYSHDVPEVIPFKTPVDKVLYDPITTSFYVRRWLNVYLYICPKCGSVFGKVENE